MQIYAWVGIAEAVVKLGFIFLLLQASSVDVLIFYGLLQCLWNISLQLFYRFYCTHNFKECRLIIVKEKNIYKSMVLFSSWNVIGSFSYSGNILGINLLINSFFGVALNAACGIAYQIENALAQFAGNFLTAAKPQIVKLYSRHDTDKMLSLVFESSKFSYLLMYVFCLPVLLEADYILKIWLHDVPEYTSVFVRLIIVVRLILVINAPPAEAIKATGDIKWFSICVGGISVLIQIPVVFILYKFGYSVESAFILRIILYICLGFIELILLKKQVQFSLRQFISKVYLISIAISLVSLVIPVLLLYFLNSGMLRLFLVCLASFISVGFWTFLLGINREGRKKIIEFGLSKIRKG
jgi:O-antigen/teichoic acid export membrane protein